MLIQFSVANFRSIREPQTLSMVASGALKRLRETNTFSPQVEGHKIPNLLRCAAIFGPNAAGKSNLVRALQHVQAQVMRSAHARPESPIDVSPFRLGSGREEGDSVFEVDFVELGTRYQFGFSVNRDRITKEWLNSYSSPRPTELYYREHDAESRRDVYRYGRSFEGGARLAKDWSAQTGPKTLFISRVVQASSDEFTQLRVPYKWFSERLRIQRPDPFSDGDMYTSRVCKTAEGKEKVVAFLNAFDIPIKDIEIASEDFEFGSEVFSDDFKRRMKLKADFKVLKPLFTHHAEDGHPVEFTSEDESDGTMNLYRFAAKWIDVLDEDRVLVVDEIDSSLHPLAVWELIRRLCESRSQAQLIFTTHDATVLRSKLLRRDQTFFMSPNRNRESELYSLLDFKGREEDAFEDRYLQGRYGATPLITR